MPTQVPRQDGPPAGERKSDTSRHHLCPDRARRRHHRRSDLHGHARRPQSVVSYLLFGLSVYEQYFMFDLYNKLQECVYTCAHLYTVSGMKHFVPFFFQVDSKRF